jgi:hypothetical protein
MKLKKCSMCVAQRDNNGEFIHNFVGAPLDDVRVSGAGSGALIYFNGGIHDRVTVVLSDAAARILAKDILLWLPDEKSPRKN